MVKLYVDEPGYETVRAVELINVSALARVEVLSALWRKHRLAGMSAASARTLVTEFENDFEGTAQSDSRFEIVRVSDEILVAAARLTGTAGLRAYDAVQLASAEAVRAADPGCDTLACFDTSLRQAAARSGFALYPRE